MYRFFALALLVGSGSACSGDECALDSDCPLFQRCSQNSCVALSAPETGPRDAGDASVDADISPSDADAPVPRGSGVVQVFQRRDSTRIGVTFTEPEAMSNCSSRSVGGCTLQECVTVAPMADGGMDAAVDAGDGGDAGDAGMPAAANAGDVSIVADADPTVLMPDPMGLYPASMTAADFFKGGDMVTANAVGADVPMFSASANAPGRVTLLMPTIDGGPTVSKAMPLDVDWDVADSPVTVALFATEMMGNTTRSLALRCTQSGGNTDLQISTAALASLPAGPGTMRVTTEQSAMVEAGTYDVRLQLVQVGNDALPGGIAEGPIIIEE
ncbi:MAG: hypothetical protein AAGF12_10570 [Myxococcota bacterium]